MQKHHAVCKHCCEVHGSSARSHEQVLDPCLGGVQPEAKTVYVLTLLQRVAHMLPNEVLFCLLGSAS